MSSEIGRSSISSTYGESAAFPVALSPVTLTNYSRCPAQEGKAWPPAWVAANIDDPGTGEGESLWHDNPQRATLGRAENAYALGKEGGERPKLFIHLPRLSAMPPS